MPSKNDSEYQYFFFVLPRSSILCLTAKALRFFISSGFIESFQSGEFIELFFCILTRVFNFSERVLNMAMTLPFFWT